MIDKNQLENMLKEHNKHLKQYDSNVIKKATKKVKEIISEMYELLIDGSDRSYFPKFEEKCRTEEELKIYKQPNNNSEHSFDTFVCMKKDKDCIHSHYFNDTYICWKGINNLNSFLDYEEVGKE